MRLLYAQKVTYIHQHSKTTCQFTTKHTHICIHTKAKQRIQYYTARQFVFKTQNIFNSMKAFGEF